MIQTQARRAATAALLALPGLGWSCSPCAPAASSRTSSRSPPSSPWPAWPSGPLLGPPLGPAVTPALVVAVVALAGFAVWVLASSGWSDAPARALLEYDRVLLYAATLVLFGLLGHSQARARGLLYGVALGALAISVAALGVWLMPDRFGVDEHFLRQRLSWPTSYWNTSGLIGALCASRAWRSRATAARSGRRASAQPRASRSAGAVIYFTVSRGALLAAVVGVVVLARARSVADDAGGDDRDRAGHGGRWWSSAARAHGKGLEFAHPGPGGAWTRASKAAVQLAHRRGRRHGLRALGLALDAAARPRGPSPPSVPPSPAA